MNTYQLWFISFTLLISITYLNFCASYDDLTHIGSPKIWPNISDNSSFLQWPLPGLTGAGGLDIDFYEKFAKAVNVSRAVPYLVAQAGNYTLAQVVVMAAVGAMACGAASLIAEAILYQHHEKELHHDLHHGPHSRIDKFSIPSKLIKLKHGYQSIPSPTTVHRPLHIGPYSSVSKYSPPLLHKSLIRKKVKHFYPTSKSKFRHSEYKSPNYKPSVSSIRRGPDYPYHNNNHEKLLH